MKYRKTGVVIYLYIMYNCVIFYYYLLLLRILHIYLYYAEYLYNFWLNLYFSNNIIDNRRNNMYTTLI